VSASSSLRASCRWARSGPVGLADRVAVLDGRLRVESPAGGGTVVEVTVPVGQATRRSTGQAVSPRSCCSCSADHSYMVISRLVMLQPSWVSEYSTRMGISA
jgi:hypothetical protein